MSAESHCGKAVHGVEDSRFPGGEGHRAILGSDDSAFDSNASASESSESVADHELSLGEDSAEE